MSFNGGYNGAFDRRGIKIRERAKQDWNVGDTVRVGFMSGLVVILCSSKTGKAYTFVPHHGISAGVTP